MTIAAALEWAWRDELPKMSSNPAAAGYAIGYGNAFSSILAFGEIGTVVDRQPNRFGCIPFDVPGWPHPDALLLAEAVEGLADCTVDVPAGWHPMPEIAAIGEGLGVRCVADAVEKATEPDGAGGRRFKMRADLLVIRYAILGLVPNWRMAETPQLRYEAHDNGRDRWFVKRETRQVIGSKADGTDLVEVVNVEVEGWSARLRRPVAGAYRKPYLDPDPVPVMVARAEYEIFAAAMCMLHDDLAGRLGTIDLVATDWPVQPWAAGDSAGEGLARRDAKILPDLRAFRDAIAASEIATKSRVFAHRKKPANSA
jgi:hypothetical protein